MPFSDITSAGALYDKHELIAQKKFMPEHFYPAIRLDSTPFIINGITCGFDRWNKTMRAIKPTSQQDVWEYDESISLNKLTQGKKKAYSLSEIVQEHHRLRGIQSRGELFADGGCGLISLMEWTDFQKVKMTGMRMLLTNLNTKMIEAYEETHGKGSFDKAFPHEKGRGAPAGYEYKLMKGLRMPTEYKKPRELSLVRSELDQKQKYWILDFLS